jgi:hypothetical protein
VALVERCSRHQSLLLNHIYSHDLLLLGLLKPHVNLVAECHFKIICCGRRVKNSALEAFQSQPMEFTIDFISQNG